MKKLLDYITNRLIEEKCQKLFFVLFMAFFVFVAFYSALTSFKGFFVDTIEHIHSSWLVSEGKLPYKDFFQHHNLLLWFLFAPVTKIFYQNPIIFSMAKGIGVIGYLTVIWIIYQINYRFIYGQKTARLSLIILRCIGFLRPFYLETFYAVPTILNTCTRYCLWRLLSIFIN